MAELMVRMAMSAIVAEIGRILSSNQIAIPNITTPNTDLTVFIQTPARGRILPAEVPINNKGVPIPIPNANRASPPNCQSCVWDINNNAPTSGAVMQGPTIMAEKKPINPTLTNEPPA